MYQTPLADPIRTEGGIATMAGGARTEPHHANTIIGAGRADLCAIARPHLADPAWTLHAAAQLSPQAATHTDWPVQYHSGRDQMLREIAKQKQMAALTAPAQESSKPAAIE
jgi:anthraniloyl-CoA monooxygenase